MSPEVLTRLASMEFSAVLAADPVIRELRSRLTDRKNLIPATLDALLLSGSICIGNLPILPLTAVGRGRIEEGSYQSLEVTRKSLRTSQSQAERAGEKYHGFSFPSTF